MDHTHNTTLLLWCPGDELEAEENFHTAEIGSATCFLLFTGVLILTAIYVYRYNHTYRRRSPDSAKASLTE